MSRYSRTISCKQREKPMQVDLYQTLKSINVTDDQAKLVVASIEEYIDDMVGDATKPLQEKIGGLQRSLETHMKTRSEEHTSELQSLMRISYAVFCLKKKNKKKKQQQ